MRTIIGVPEDQVRAIDAETRGALLEATHGIWADRPEDGLAMQRRLRSEWDDR